MSDPRAALILAAQDETGRAFTSANANLRTLESNAERASKRLGGGFGNVGRSISQARTALAAFGVALSARAFVNWIGTSVLANDATIEQTEGLQRAREAVTSLSQAWGDLGRAVGTQAAPAYAGLARSLSDMATIVAGTNLQKAQKGIRDLDERIALHQTYLRATKQDEDALMGVWREQRAELDLLRQKYTEIENAKPSSRPEFFGGGPPDASQLEFDAKIREQQQRMAERMAEASARAREQEQKARQSEAERAAQAELELVTAVYAERDRLAQVETEETERRRELLATQVEDVRHFTLTELEVEVEAHARRQEILREAHEAQLIEKGRYYQLSEELAARSAQNIADIEKRAHQEERQRRAQIFANAAAMFSGLAAISAAGGEESKRQFEQNKKIQTANAIVQTLSAVTAALANPPGPPWSIPQAVAAGLFGFAQVRQIQSTTWGGGGGAMGVAGGARGGASAGAVAAPASDMPLQRSEARAQTVVQFHVHGNVIGAGGKAELGEYFTRLVREHVDRTDDVIIATRSRNGQNLSAP